MKQHLENHKAFLAIKNCALNLLAGREHSQYELRCKLRLRKFNDKLIGEIIDELAAEGLQSDQRFVESYIQMRFDRGYGPIRIATELQARGIKEDIIAIHLENTDEIWIAKMLETHRKKFGSKKPKDFREYTKQMRFLQYRGFAVEQIARHFKI